MFFGALGQGRRLRQQIMFETMEKYVSEIDLFTHFCEQAQLRNYESPLTTSSFAKADKLVLLAAKTIPGIKLIRPLRRLCTRLIEANQGLTLLHVRLIKLCLSESLPREALPIVKSKALPKRLSRLEYGQFSRLCGLIYLQLEDFYSAYTRFHQSCREETQQFFSQLDSIKKLILLSIIIGRPESPHNVKNIYESMRVFTQAETIELHQTDEQLTVYIDVLANTELSQGQIQILRRDNHWDLYLLGRRRAKDAQLGNEMRAISDMNQRLRMENFKEVPLGGFSLTRNMNFIYPFYKYDCQDRSARFIHKNTSDEEVNLDVTRAMNCYLEVIRNRGIEKSSDKTTGGMNIPGLGRLMHR